MRIRELFRRPIVAMLLMVALFAILFPRFGPREVVVHAALAPCATELEVAAYEKGTLARKVKRSVRGEVVMRNAFDLPAGEYLLRLTADCGESSVNAARKLVLEDDTELRFDLAKTCVCPRAGGPGQG